jgi:hypothetical protein
MIGKFFVPNAPLLALKLWTPIFESSFTVQRFLALGFLGNTCKCGKCAYAGFALGPFFFDVRIA